MFTLKQGSMEYVDVYIYPSEYLSTYVCKQVYSQIHSCTLFVNLTQAKESYEKREPQMRKYHHWTGLQASLLCIFLIKDLHGSPCEWYHPWAGGLGLYKKEAKARHSSVSLQSQHSRNRDRRIPKFKAWPTEQILRQLGLHRESLS